MSLRRAHDINDGGIDGDPEPWIITWGIAFGESDDPRHAYLLVPLEECLGDVDGDGEIAFADLTTLLMSWGSGPSCRGKICREDLDFNLVVGFADLTLMLLLWGPCGSQESQSPGLPMELGEAWLTVGGADAIESGTVTAAQIAQCMQQPSPGSRFSALMGLLSQESQE